VAVVGWDCSGRCARLHGCTSAVRRVQAVAKAAVAAATDPSVASGVLDVWDIKKYERGA
jgi:hypothetical protein